MTNIIIKNNIKKIIKEIDKENQVGNVAGDVAEELEKNVIEILEKGVKRAKNNNRRTLFGRDL